MSATVTPAPAAQNLVTMIECTADPETRFGVEHRITIRTDWSVECPHDLEAERIARSFGGWSTCLAVADVVVPALRRALTLMHDPSELSTDGDATHELREAYAAVQHEIAPRSILPALPAGANADPALRTRERELFAQLFSEAGRSWAAAADARQIDGGAAGFRTLWAEGVSPARVDEIARGVPRRAWPLPVDFVALAHFGPVDLEWLFGLIHCFPDREVVDWAVQQRYSGRRAQSDNVWRLAELGLSPRDAIGVLDQRVPLDALVAIASHPDVGAPTAARWLTLWAQLGVTPTREHYRVLAETRALSERPPSWKVDSIAHALRGFGHGAPDRTELAVMLALVPDQAAVERAIRRGVTTATDPRFLEITRKEHTR